MANNTSALKRIKINERNNKRNKIYKVAMRKALKDYLLAVENYRVSPTSENLALLKGHVSTNYKKIDKCSKINLLHSNTAARKKSRLMLILNQLK
jgi:small subunit ribosomal protein S20